MTASGNRRLPWLVLLALLAAVPSLAAVPALATRHTVLRSTGAAVVEMRTAALIMSGQQGGALPIAVGVLPGGGAITAMVEIDGAALRQGDGAGAPLALQVYAYVLGAELEVLDQSSLAVDLDPAAHPRILASTGVKAFLPLELPVGARLLRVLVRAGESFGVRSLELAPGDLPASAGAGEARVLWPVFHELDQPWLLAVPGAGEVALPPPFGLGNDDPLPTTRPVLSAGEAISGLVFLAGPRQAGPRQAGPRQAGAPELTALVRSPGREASAVLLEIVARSDMPGGLEAVAFSFAAPGDLEPGLYEIAVALTPASGDTAAPRSSFVPVFIDSGPTAASPAGSGGADHPVAAINEPLGKAQRDRLRAVAAGYRRALDQLAAGDRPAALATLAAGEARVVEALDAGAVAVLAQGESGLLATLADGEWQCVLPVVLLHLDSSREYRRDRRFILAHHATQRVLALAEAYAEKLATPAAALEAARAVTSLAGSLQHGGALSQAERLFSHALTLAEVPAAALGLASILEKRGRFEEAVPWLERLVAAQPENEEGRLRLALNHYRTGKTEVARRALERLTASGEGWVALLAHQELARLEIDRGGLRPAAAVLRRGLARWPSHPTLVIQLAWVSAAGGNPTAAHAMLAGLELSDTTHPAGERSRYNRWPETLLRSDRRTLDELAAARLDDLRHWLDSQPQPGAE